MHPQPNHFTQGAVSYQSKIENMLITWTRLCSYLCPAVSLVAPASVQLQAELGPVSPVPWVVFEPKEQHLEMGIWRIANGRKFHSSPDIKAL